VNTVPRMALMATAAALWIAVLPALGLFPDTSRRPIIFLLGAALAVLALLHRPAAAEDPGPFVGGVGEQRRAAPSFGFLVLIVGVAFALRAITLGHPVAGDHAAFLGNWQPPPDNPFVARLPFAVCGALTPAIIYVLVRRVLAEPVARLTALALAVAPAHIVVSQAVGPVAPAMLAGVLATWALAAAAAHDRPMIWTLYGGLSILAMALGPWAVALPIGHAVAYLVWILLRRLVGFPPPPIWRFFVTVVLAAAAGAFLVDLPDPVTSPVESAGPTWTWIPLAGSGGALAAIAWALAGLGLLRLVTARPSAPVWLLVVPGITAWLLPHFWGAFANSPDPAWPALAAVVVLGGFGLFQVLASLRTIGTWIFPGRVPAHVYRHIGLVLAIAVLALAMVSGLRKHYHRPSAPASVTQPTQ